MTVYHDMCIMTCIMVIRALYHNDTVSSFEYEDFSIPTLGEDTYPNACSLQADLHAMHQDGTALPN